MKIKSLMFLVLAGLFSSCQKKTGLAENATLFDNSDFVQKEYLKGEVFNTDPLMKPTRIYVHDSLLYLVDAYSDNFVHIFSKLTGKKVSEKIPRGKGHNELLSCWSLQFVDDQVLAFDLVQSKVNRYLVKDFIKSGSIDAVKSVSFDGSVTSVATLSDCSFVASDLNDTQSMMTHFDTSGKKNNSIHALYPTITDKYIPDEQNKRFWENRIYYNQHNDKIVVFYIYCDLIEIYDSNMNLVNRIQGPDCFAPELGVRDVDNNKFAYLIPEKTKFSYLFGVLTDNEIWGLYYGIVPQKGAELQNTIFVFDYNGRPIRQYELDIPVSYFGVDTENNCIFGISENPEPVIVRFPIKNDVAVI